MRRSIVAVFAVFLLAMLGADQAAAELRFGTAIDQREANAPGAARPHIGDIAQVDGGYDPADGRVAVSVSFHDQEPASFGFAFYRGRTVRRGDDCERRGRGPAFTGTVNDPTPRQAGAYPIARPSTGSLSGVEGSVAGGTSASEGGRRITATFKSDLLRDRGYRCMVVRSADPGNTGFGTATPPADRAQLFFLGFAPQRPTKPEPEPQPEPKPRRRLTPRTAAEYVITLLAKEYSREQLDRRAGRFVSCPRAAFTRFRGRRTAFCVFRVSLARGRGAAGSVGVQLVRTRFRSVGLEQVMFTHDLRRCPSLDGRLRAGGLVNCDQAVDVAQTLRTRPPGRNNVLVGGGNAFKRLRRFECRIARGNSETHARCANGLGDRVVYIY